eukprot:1229520-Prymnesium_polylepis.1
MRRCGGGGAAQNGTNEYYASWLSGATNDATRTITPLATTRKALLLYRFCNRVAVRPTRESAVRSVPLSIFLSNAPQQWPLPMTSINEDRLLENLGVVRKERDVIEGLQQVSGNSSDLLGTSSSTVEELSSQAVARLAANPPPAVGTMQRRTTQHLLRPFPLGLRFSGYSQREV